MKFIFILFSLFFALVVIASASDVLVYTGTGATSGDIAAVETIISDLNLSYSTANSSQINVITRSQLDSYKLIVWPGGNSISMGNSLTKAAATNIHNAVVLDGVSYVGFCAGAFIAERSSIYNTFALAGTYFNFYQEGMIETVPLTFPASQTLYVVYWDGPQLTGFGKVVAKYPDGTPAIAESYVGSKNALVILSGVHPEATSYWGVTNYIFADAGADNNYAKTIISAAYQKAALPHY